MWPRIFPEAVSLSHSFISCVTVTLPVACYWWQFLYTDKLLFSHHEEVESISLFLNLGWPLTVSLKSTGLSEESYLSIFVCICVCVYIYVCVCVYVCIYVFLHGKIIDQRTA